jgi:K+-transporting ATPase KdpF subunit
LTRSERNRSVDEEGQHAGHHFHRSNGAVFYGWSFLCSRLRTLEVRSELMHAGDAALLVICALLFGYLLYALLKAEEF